MMSRAIVSVVAFAVALVAPVARVHAHSGPPFPIVSNQLVGAYDVSLWTDPDATDDGQAAGQFWVVIQPAARGATLPSETRASVAIRPTDRGGDEQVAVAAPVNGAVSRQFAALRMDHEGRFAVRVTIDGPLGRAEVASAVDATYDQRPAPFLLVVYLIPFLAIGALWIRLLRRRRTHAARTSNAR